MYDSGGILKRIAESFCKPSTIMAVALIGQSARALRSGFWFPSMAHMRYAL